MLDHGITGEHHYACPEAQAWSADCRGEGQAPEGAQCGELTGMFLLLFVEVTFKFLTDLLYCHLGHGAMQ